MLNSALRNWLAVAFSAAAIVAVGSCSQNVLVDKSVFPYARSSGLGCDDSRPTDQDREVGIAVVSAEQYIPTVEAALNASLRKEREAHDCQELIVKSTRAGVAWEYSTFATIWSADRGRGTDEFRNGDVAAIVTKPERDPDHLPLGLVARVNCLVLKGTDDSDNWQAWMIPAPDTAACGRLKQFDDVFTIPVKRILTRVDEPVTSRWLEIKDGYVIGVKCGKNGWCYVGKLDATDESRLPTNGRGDRQRLSDWDNRSIWWFVDHQLWVTELNATIEPWGTPSDEPNDYKNGKQVASVMFEGGSKRAKELYAKKLEIDHIVKEVPSGVPVGVFLKYYQENDESDRWRIYYQIDKEDRVVEKKAKYIKMTGSKNEGATRWRWTWQDEGVWIQCPEGCCGDPFKN